MAQTDSGTIEVWRFASKTLGEEILYNVYLPPGYAALQARCPVLYLLHGRGDDCDVWARCTPVLDRLIGKGMIPPLIAIMPDAPYSDYASYYVDSHYRGLPPGYPVETAFIRDLLPHVDETYRTLAHRGARAVGGYSMGGYGALRYALAYPTLFMGAIVLSPAVYTPLPPLDSTARSSGAFGKGETLFDPDRYRQKNYPALLGAFTETGLPLHLFIAVGDDELKHTLPEEYQHDLDFEAHLLFNRVVRVPHITAELRVLDGGHDWSVWLPAFREGVVDVFQHMDLTPNDTPQ